MTYVLLFAFLLFALRRLLTYLHIYQQEEYQPVRFLRWVATSGSFDRRASIAILFTGLVERTTHMDDGLAKGFVVASLVAVAFVEKDPRKASKKKLNMTSRATRIYWTAFVLAVAFALLYSLPGVPVIAWVFPVQLIPITLVLANLILVPYEKHVQQGFWNEAHRKLLSLKPITIGITGSYGKTSTKHLLGHILEVQAPTLITPGSVNTPMGIARIVRERLGAHHRFFVCEMGAYGPGSIARLCKLAPPDFGVLTAIGMAHYERFKTLDTVAKAKLELAEAALAKQGSVVFYEQVLELADARSFQARNPAKTIVVGQAVDASFRLSDMRQEADGLHVAITWQERTYNLWAPLFGEHHISNMAVAFATACTLGISPDDVVTALATVPQIAHRLEVKTGVNGSRLIDDAYNSNPVGFASGLRLLDKLKQAGGRRILVTPGMVELGQAHDDEHARIGQLSGEFVDVLVPVVPGRLQSLINNFRERNPAGLVVACANLAEAQNWLSTNVVASDVVLMENDLPDLYEARLIL